MKKWICALLAGCFFFVAFAPDYGWSLTVSQEEELARKFLKAAKKQFEFIDDPSVVNYVNRVGNRIVSGIPSPRFSYRFYVIKNDEYNAFAIPAGHIFVHTGLLTALESEDELVGILSHEIAHVECRHISERFEQSKKIQVGTMAGLAAGILLGASGAGDVASAVGIGSMAAGQSATLAYSREHESQADQMGLSFMNQCGYSGAGLLSTMQKLREKQWFGPEQVPSYLRTHPASEERLVQIGAWLDTQDRPIKRSGEDSLGNFQMIRARVIALHGNPDDALRRFKLDVDKDPSDAVSQFGYGLVLDRTNKCDEAIAHLKAALSNRAFDPEILKSLGIAYYNGGKYHDALSTLEAATMLAKKDPEPRFYLGRTQAALDNVDAAVDIFEDLVADWPAFAPAYYFLGETYGKLGKLGDAHFYLGRYYQIRKDNKNAVFHLEKVLNSSADDARKEQARDSLAVIRKEQAAFEKDKKSSESAKPAPSRYPRRRLGG